MIYKTKFLQKFKYIAGVDEAGRGPIAGPLVVASVILPKNRYFLDLNDSKKVSAKNRKILFKKICKFAITYSIEIVSSEQIEKMNILQATLFAMEKSVRNLAIKPNFCLIDGNIVPKGLKGYALAVVRGDEKYASIAAASIISKVTRDMLMILYHDKYPQYDFKTNKGYPTPKHLLALQKFGICEIHRRKYRPVREIILKKENRQILFNN